MTNHPKSSTIVVSVSPLWARTVTWHCPSSLGIRTPPDDKCHRRHHHDCGNHVIAKATRWKVDNAHVSFDQVHLSVVMFRSSPSSSNLSGTGFGKPKWCQDLDAIPYRWAIGATPNFRQGEVEHEMSWRSRQIRNPGVQMQSDKGGFLHGQHMYVLKSQRGLSA